MLAAGEENILDNMEHLLNLFMPNLQHISFIVT